MSKAMLRKILYIIGLIIVVCVIYKSTQNDTAIIMGAVIFSTLTLIDVVGEN
jgi:hypothetical protein